MSQEFPKTSEYAHTPTPWMTNRAGEMLPDDWMIMADMGMTPNGIQQVSTVARVLSIRQTPETTAANAAFIVECVNNHARLTAELAASRKALESVEHYIRQDVNDVGLEMLSQEYANLWHEVNAALQGHPK